MRRTPCLVCTVALAASCGDDSGSAAQETGAGSGPATSDGSQSTATPATDGTTWAVDETTAAAEDTAADATTGAETTSAGDASGSAGSSTGVQSACDFETVNSMIVMEAESLPVGEDWQVLTDEVGFYADGYIGWTGSPFNNDPTHGVTSVTVHVDEPGRYRLQWRNRIGMGAEPTEHNDTWVKFPDAASYYGLRLQGKDEQRVYPRPACEDVDAMAQIEALPQVIAAVCVAGSSSDDWFKVYSSGATDWAWSTNTNDNNGHSVMVEFEAVGDYSFSIAARGDWHLIDRIVIHEESVDNAAVQDADAVQTACTGG